MHTSEQRSLRLPSGTASRVTSVRLETPFWGVLERMAAEAECTMAQLVSFIDARHREGDASTNESRTLTSCLRVACLRWSASQKPFTSAPATFCIQVVSTPLDHSPEVL